MEKTPNYQLNQWEAGDRVQRTDFNADNVKIDAALRALAEEKAEVSDLEALSARTLVMKAGTYTGDGTAERFISLGFNPKAVYVCTSAGVTYSRNSSGSGTYTYFRGGLAVAGAPVTNGEYLILEIVSDGFKVFKSEKKVNNVSFDYHYTNSNNVVYHYIAFK